MMDLGPVILRHAASSSWANPHGDQQFLLRPQRITPKAGTRGAYRLPHMSFVFPEPNKLYVGYEFGHLDPKFLGLHNLLLNWVRLSDVCKNETIVANAFVNHRQLLLSTIWVKRTPNRNLLIAVEVEPNRALLSQSEDRFYLRMYSNAWYQTTEGQVAEGVRVGSVYLDTIETGSNLMATYNSQGYASRGMTMWFHNGFYCDRPLVGNLTVGDTLEYIWDSSGLEYFDVPLAEAAGFVSKMDLRRKLIIMAPEHINDDFLYFDDMEFYLCSYDNDGRVRGIYLDSYNMSDVRQLTYRDWALDSDRVNQLYYEQDGELSFGKAFVRVFVRHSTTIERNVADGNYMNDLFMADYHTRQKILAGTVSVVPQWRADELERSAYLRWLDMRSTQLTEENVRGVYNYYGVRQCTQMPVKVSIETWQLPATMQDGGLILLLDANGELHSKVTLTEAQYGGGSFTAPAEVETLLLYPGQSITDTTTMDAVEGDFNNEWSFYAEDRYYQPNVGGGYVLAQLGTDYDLNPTTQKIDWDISLAGKGKLRRSGGQYLLLERTLGYAEIGHPIVLVSNEAMPLSKQPFGRVDVWFGKRRGAPGIDYVVKDFTLYIVNREYLDWTLPVADNAQQVRLTILAHGVADTRTYGRYGFVMGGMVNQNQRVDLSKLRNQRFYLSGQSHPQDELVYAENYRGKQTLQFTRTGVLDWRANTSYDQGDVVAYRHRLYVAERNMIPTTVFDDTLWSRIYKDLPYRTNESTPTYVELFELKGVLQCRVLRVGTVDIERGEVAPVRTDVTYTHLAGLPPQVPIAEGSLYYFEYPPKHLNSILVRPYSDTYEEAQETDASLSAFLTEMMPQVDYAETVVINRQHKVVSVLMRRLITAILQGELVVEHNNMSDMAVDNKLIPYRHLLDLDICRNPTVDHRFVEVYSHAEMEKIGLGPWETAFLTRVNDLYLNDRIVLSRDTYIT